MKNSLAITVIIAVVVGVLGFFGGMKYQQRQRSNFTFGNGQFAQGGPAGQSGARNFNRNGNGNNNFRPVRGQIISSDANSITVKLPNGNSLIVLLTNNTTIDKMTPASKNDLTSGAQVAAFGTANSDGSITAENIQLNPENLRRAGNGQNATPSSTGQQ